MAISCIVSEIKSVSGQKSLFFHTPFCNNSWRKHLQLFVFFSQPSQILDLSGDVIRIYIYKVLYLLTDEVCHRLIDTDWITISIAQCLTQTHPAVARCWFGGNTRSCLRDVVCRLLQCNPRRGCEDNNEQATMSVKRSCTSRQRHQKVWSGTVTTDAPGVTLTGHFRVSKLQAGSADPPVSARQGASVPIKLLHSSQSGSYTVASTLRCTSAADCTSTSSQHLRSAGICCRWSDDV